MNTSTRPTLKQRSRVAKMTAQPSTWAGLAGLAQAVPMLIATPANPLLWAAAFGSLAAVLKNEAGSV